MIFGNPFFQAPSISFSMLSVVAILSATLKKDGMFPGFLSYENLDWPRLRYVWIDGDETVFTIQWRLEKLQN